MKRVLLAGEGATELGSRAGHPAYRSGDGPGVLETLLRKVEPAGWEVGRTMTWRHIRKLRVGRGHEDERNVQVLALDAKDAGCDVLAFSRDRDRDAGRRDAIERGIAAAQQQDPSLRIAGGIAAPCTEGWMLALLGRRQTEELSVGAACDQLAATGCRGTVDMVGIIQDRSLEEFAADARSLTIWLDRARVALRSD